jgi:hypothetical protein
MLTQRAQCGFMQGVRADQRAVEIDSERDGIQRHVLLGVSGCLHQLERAYFNSATGKESAPVAGSNTQQQWPKVRPDRTFSALNCVNHG